MTTEATHRDGDPAGHQTPGEPVRRAHSRAADPRDAASELRSGLGDDTFAAVVLFASTAYDLAGLAAAVTAELPGVLTIGCTTAGEIGAAGYVDGSVSAVGLAASSFVVSAARIADLDAFDEAAARETAAGLLAGVDGPSEQCFSLLLIDGLSIREERVARQCQRALGDVPLIGGSAGDDQAFAATYVLHDGRFDHGAVWVVVRTALPFAIFRSSHFVGQGEPLVVTAADAERRIVKEINGLPAAREYARVVGVEVSELSQRRVAAAPLVVKLGGNDYVRSIQRVNEDESLTLYCAIERGVVLRVARGLELVDARRDVFDDVHRRIGQPLLTLAFDCIQCKVEAEHLDGKRAVQELFLDHNVVGFAGYGEQFVGTHVNQTFTGVAIGGGRA